jgi:hypothetical protein
MGILAPFLKDIFKRGALFLQKNSLGRSKEKS